MEVDSLRLEPNWVDITLGQSVDILVETVIWDPHGEKHLVRSALHRRFLRVEGKLQQSVAYSLMNFRVTSLQQGISISQGEGSQIFPHEIATIDDLFTVKEVCSGIGVMSDGLISSGATIPTKNELRETLVDFQSRQGVGGMVQGDIGDLQVLSAFFHQHPRPSMIAAGFSCQPWSRLGDKNGFQDFRASSLCHTLRTAYFCRSHALLLECVTEAGSDKTVKAVIQNFCRCTGFHMHEGDLHLDHFWPSRRSRWWCLILNPAVQPFEIRALPVQAKPPTVNDLFPIFPAWPTDEEDQLSLDLYETNKFIEFQSFDRAIIKGDSPLPTALHGWANQLQGCPCKCRSSSMDHSRLAKRGIFGALVVMEGMLESCQGQLTRTRHLHPWELSVLTGALPDKVWQPCLRLGICGLGQMASPIQSAWMYGQYQFELGKQLGMTDLKSPEIVLWEHVQQVFDAYQMKFPEIFNHPSVGAFVSNTFDLLWEAHMHQIVPSSVYHLDVDNTGDNDDHIVMNLNPTQEQMGNDAIIEQNDEHPMTSVHDDGYADPDQEWECPFDDCCICEPKTTIPLPSFEQSSEGIQHWDAEPVSPTIPFSVCERTPIADPFTPVGGVVAFSTKRNHDEQEDTSAKRAKFSGPTVVLPQVDGHHSVPIASFPGDMTPKMDENFSQKVQDNIWDQERLAATGVDAKQVPHREQLGTNFDSHHVQVFYPWSSTPSFLKVKKDVTVGCIEVAESDCGNIMQPVRTNNVVGVKLPIASTTIPFQQLVFQYAPDFKHGPIDKGPNWPLDTTHDHSRVELLFRQEGWVAEDEMNFYLGVLEKAGLGVAEQAFVIHPDCMDTSTWIQTCIEKSSDHSPLLTAILVEHHWIPVVVSKTPQGTRVSSTQQGLDMLQPGFGDGVETMEIFTPQRFHADCGFQSIGAIIQATADATLALPDVQRVFPIDSATAVSWRRMFENHLFITDKAKSRLMIHQLVLGGALGETPEDKLRDLFIAHGVPADVVAERISQAFARLGRPKILQAIRSHRPWQELKNISNEASPKFQLVLPSELQVVIQSRASRPKPFGDKKHKQHRTENKTPIVIRPEDVSVPAGIFKQGQSDLVCQIPVQSIGPEACGVVVISATDAAPYLKLSRPISKQGLGLLILDHTHDICQGLGHVLRFPCKCEKNGEPVIVTARLIQIGCTEVTRHYPEQVASVDEIPTVVVRALLYRDEVAEKWTDITDRPVKHLVQILDLPADADGPKSILDIWDRQFLTIKMSKSKPKESDIFVVSLRLSSSVFDGVMQKNGCRGLYLEPRTSDGRQPSTEYRVVWLARTDKGTATTALQTTTGHVTLARSGLRFGIRALVAEIESIHNQHKAHLPYLDTHAALKYLAGPFPYGATREGILKVFSGWGWSARPVQPKGRTGDGQGIQWEVLASAPPECEVYSMKHGDVILTLLESKKQHDKIVHDVMASAKTIALLRQTSTKPASSSIADPDPLQQFDPWASYQPPKVAKTNPHVEALPKGPSLDVINAQFERRLAETLHQVDQKLASNDTAMSEPNDHRIEAFENRLQQLENNMHLQHQSQQQHQQQVSVQFQQVQQQIESQSSNFQAHLDQKMTERLAQIEMLLGKKQRRE